MEIMRMQEEKCEICGSYGYSKFKCEIKDIFFMICGSCLRKFIKMGNTMLNDTDIQGINF